MNRLLLFIASVLAAGNAFSQKTLKSAYADAFMMGCAINSQIVSGRDSRSTEIILQQFNAVSPENDMKAEVIHPRPDTWNFEPADRFVKFANDNNLWSLGHTLVWHNQTPDFFFNHPDGTPKTKDEMVETMRSYIEKVAGHFAGKIDAWDVVNEIIDNDGSYRKTVWTNAFEGDGDELVRLAFKFASQYDPNAELYYNDFNAWRPTKRDGIARMVRMLQEHGIRIDGVGIQAHWGLNFPKNEYIIAAIDTFAALGVKVMITEMDVDVLPLTREGQVIGRILQDPLFQLEEFEIYLDPYKTGLPDDVQERLTDRYRELMQIFYDRRDKIDRVTFWGLHDGMSWKNGYPIPNRTNYPLLFNRDRTPKPAFHAILEIPEQ
ncbi:MAG: endo-1,4-beta-xylanase [Bacteroidaceae bacterium]|jgi:endo-1,4-beta-xylanase|nr:endo-1,4-beta-xylanase [Bacteroidaceae bacterium]HOD68399.1 endo-1,4-beta-xylanase [Bacteroidaceae bacterium]HQL25851.1 endo-1,4-beta-xylanase [Bacteroidaceae bacterium]